MSDPLSPSPLSVETAPTRFTPDEIRVINQAAAYLDGVLQLGWHSTKSLAAQLFAIAGNPLPAPPCPKCLGTGVLRYQTPSEPLEPCSCVDPLDRSTIPAPLASVAADTVNLTNACRVCGAWAQTGDERCNECVAQNRAPAPPDGAPTGEALEQVCRDAIHAVWPTATGHAMTWQLNALRWLESNITALLALRAERDEALRCRDDMAAIVLLAQKDHAHEVAELRADKARLDWWEQNPLRISAGMNRSGPDGTFTLINNGGIFRRFASLREAIDNVVPEYSPASPHASGPGEAR